MTAHSRTSSRRAFLAGAGAAAASVTIVPRHVLGRGFRPPSQRVQIAAIGIDGRGRSNVGGMGGQTIVALCDVDARRGAASRKANPKAKMFVDFRRMFDKMEKDIDACVISTPDHTHAVAAMAAITRGKHVYCEKPLAHSVGEVRALMAAARKHKVVTQLGNQGHSSQHIRMFCEWIWDGAIGDVTEIHASCGARHCWIDKLGDLKQKTDVPAGLEWDLWLGPAAFRPYHPLYMPGKWRKWMPFGTGTLGDWVCHVIDPSFWALDLGAPASVQAETNGYDPGKHALCYPPDVKITYQFAAKGKRPPVKLIWFDGDSKIPRPAELEPGRNAPGTGAVVIGTRGKIMHGSHGASPCRIIPETAMKAYTLPPQKLPRVRGHHDDWLTAVRKGVQAGSNFNYGGPLTELALLGLIAIRHTGTKLLWDGQAARFTNSPTANALLNPPYRQGWSL